MVTIREGHRVLMFYRSANFGDEVFADPYTFDILRDPSPHGGFGGGEDYCIGSNLAGLTISVMLNAIAVRMPDLIPISPSERPRSGWLNGITHWQVEYHGKGTGSRCQN